MTDDLARSRFFVIQLVRLSGAVMVVAGLAVLVGKLDLPRAAGVVLALVGLFDFAVAPMLLARRWKSPPQEPPR